MAKYDARWRDPYEDPRTGILRNRVGATDQATLDRIESEFSTVRDVELALRPEPGRYDLDHLQRVHRRLFGDVYDWAGELRMVNIAKGTTTFAPHAMIRDYAAQVFAQLAGERHLRGLPPDRFADRAGYFMGEINVLHPFREGNGRAQRAFLGQLAREAGYQIAWDGITREQMVGASIRAAVSDAGGLASLIRANLAVRVSRDLPTPATIDPVPGQRYVGPIVALDATSATQAVGDVLVRHARSRLTGRTGALEVGKTVTVRYTGRVGHVALTEVQGRGR